MAGIIATNSSTEVEIASGDELYVPEDVVIAVTVGRGIDSDDSLSNDRRVVVDGAVVSTASNAIILRDDADDVGLNFLLIGKEGVVRTLNYAVNSAIWVYGSDSLIDNAGEVSGGFGVFVQDYDGSAIVNSGIMSGAARAGEAAGITMFLSTDVRIENSGLVTGGAGILAESSDFFLRNSGEVVGFVGAGVDATEGTPSGAVTIVNTGLVSGATAAVVGAGFDDVVRNNGEMIGDVLLGDGADRYDARRGFVDGVVRGEAGEDDLRGGQHDDALHGGSENDALRGRGGDDELHGDDGADLLVGGRDDDLLFGGAGNDVLRGGRGDDEIDTGAGRDVVVIGRGNGEDRILQFANNRDKVDLAAFGFDNFNQVRRAAERADGGVLIDLEDHGGGSVWLGGLGFGRFDAGDVLL